MIGDGSDTPVLWSIVPAFVHIILSLNNLLKALWQLWQGLMDWMTSHHLEDVSVRYCAKQFTQILEESLFSQNYLAVIHII